MAYHKGDLSSARAAFLITGGYGSAPHRGVNEMLLAWLQNNGATAKDLNGAWMQFLNTAGFTTGSLNDRKLAYFYSVVGSVVPKTLPDLEREFWAGSYGPP